MRKIRFLLCLLGGFAISYEAMAQEMSGNAEPALQVEKKPKLTVTYANEGGESSLQSEQNLPPVKEIKFVKDRSGKPGHKMPRRKFDWVKRLKLNEWQQKKLAEIENQSEEKIKVIHQEMVKLRNKEEEIRNSDEQKIRQILDERQQKKFDKIIRRLHHRPRK